MSPGGFGFFGIFVAMSSILGAMLSKKLLTRLQAERIIVIGTIITMLGPFPIPFLLLAELTPP